MVIVDGAFVLCMCINGLVEQPEDPKGTSLMKLTTSDLTLDNVPHIRIACVAPQISLTSLT